MKTKQVVIEERTLPVVVTEKPLQVKEWFAAKKFREIRNSRIYDNTLFAIIGETEKAYNCLVGSLATMINTWVPKSLVEIDESERKRSTFVCSDYNEAKGILNDIREYWD